jgi:hypothetical protein
LGFSATSGPGSLEERFFAEGSVIQMIDRYSRETPAQQRMLLLITGDLQYKPAEIQSLAKALAAGAEATRALTRQPFRVKGMRY